MILSCNKWELEAILEGLYLRQVQYKEMLSGLALEMRYTLNAKSVKASKLSKKKDRDKIRSVFSEGRVQSPSTDDFAEKVNRLNNYFKNR